jgi:hypothetical protein
MLDPNKQTRKRSNPGSGDQRLKKKQGGRRNSRCGIVTGIAGLCSEERYRRMIPEGEAGIYWGFYDWLDVSRQLQSKWAK